MSATATRTASLVRHDRTLARALAHKRGLDQVFLTDHVALPDGRSVLGALLPRSHGFYREHVLDAAPPDLALLIEVCRQACFVVAHENDDVPHGVQFLLQEITADLHDLAPAPADGPIALTVWCTTDRLSRQTFRWTFSLEHGDRPMATVSIRMLWVDRAQWRVIRSRMRTDRGLTGDSVAPFPPASDVPPARVGRVNPANVVITDVRRDGGDWCAAPVADLRHPTLFDHAIDHLYGMFQIETVRQLSLYALEVPATTPTARTLVSTRSEFASILEFDMPTDVRVTVAPDDAAGGPVLTSAVLEQGGRRASRHTFGFADASPAGGGVA